MSLADLDLARLRRVAPLVLPVLIVAIGWFALISPVMTERVEAGRAADQLRQQLAELQAATAEPPPPASGSDPVAAFTSRTVAGDASSRVVLQLATLAQHANAVNLSIETGNRTTASDGRGPQASGSSQPVDPRLALFSAPLAYTPITMSFDADFAAVGEVLWALRDLPTTIELRRMEITPRASRNDAAGTADPRVRVTLVIFAFARENRDEA